MSEQRDPVRWKDGAAAEWPDGFHEALASYSRTVPSAAAQTRMLERLEAELSDLAPASQSGGRVGWWLAAGCALTAALVAWFMLAQAAPRAPAARPPTPSQQLPAPAASARVIENVPAAPVEPVDAKPEPPPSKHPARSAPRAHVAPQKPAAIPTAPPPSAAPTPAAPDARAELELLIRARSVVSSDPARALSLAVEHAARYPESVFREEREVLAIQAEHRLGHHAAAAERTRRFVREHPSSLHRQALESGVGD